VRVRRARHDLLSGDLNVPEFRGHNYFKVAGVAEKLALIRSDLAPKLAAMDRYERRAFSRRKFAIREFDEARRKDREKLGL